MSTVAMRQNMSLLLSIVSVAYVPYPATIMKKKKLLKGVQGGEEGNGSVLKSPGPCAKLNPLVTLCICSHVLALF